jgi:hypothetical protein
LTGGEIKNKFACMRYGERLRRARAETTQADLSALNEDGLCFVCGPIEEEKE